MLFHHGTNGYEEAATQAAKNARTKLEALIEKGKQRAMSVIEKVQATTIDDTLLSAKSLKFEVENNDILVNARQDGRNTFHSKALQQATSRADIPSGFTNFLLGKPYGRELLVKNLNTIYQNMGDDKFLARSVQGEIRGFLSDRFRRLDSRPIIESFALACNRVGALPVEGYSLDNTKIMIKAVLPQVFEPIPNEVLAMGVVIENSDYGHGALSVRIFALRLWCTNFAIAEESMRKVHLGSRLDDISIYSNTTHELDSKTIASAVNDQVTHQLSEAKVGNFLEAIKKANEEKIEGKSVGEYLKKRFTAPDREEIVGAFNSPDIENLPPGNTIWRLSNAISWIAGTRENEEEKTDLMKEAGRIINVKA